MMLKVARTLAVVLIGVYVFGVAYDNYSGANLADLPPLTKNEMLRWVFAFIIFDIIGTVVLVGRNILGMLISTVVMSAVGSVAIVYLFDQGFAWSALGEVVEEFSLPLVFGLAAAFLAKVWFAELWNDS